MDPATQATHPVFAVTVHRVDRRVPAAHTVQEEHIAAFVTVLYVDPAMQFVHTLFVVAVQAVDAYLPAAHVVQAVQEAALVVVL